MIICEIGLNHMGKVQYANEYVDRIIKAKSDGILFHLREKSFYKNKKNSKLLLPEEFYFNACRKLHRHKIKFGITLADPAKIDLCESIGVDFYKIFSRDISNNELFQVINRTKKKTFVSTGMSDLTEIKRFVSKIKNHKNRFTIIHTQLDHNLNAVNLKVIPILKKKFRMNVAYGNHSSNTNVLFVAVAYEPSDYLFYVKGNKTQKHIDEDHAIKLDEINQTIHNLKELPKSLGRSIKLKRSSRIK